MNNSKIFAFEIGFGEVFFANRAVFFSVKNDIPLFQADFQGFQNNNV